jgi:hypothetical protein
MHSRHDVIQGFETGVSAVGGRRFAPLSGASSSNRIDLNLQGTLIATTTADLTLFGAASLAAGVPAGDGNTARLLIRDATGSGPRANVYSNSDTLMGGDLGVGNTLEIVGSENAFRRANEGFDPPPPAEFFTAKR